MGFGQQSGPPASVRQVQQLLALLHEAGHEDFRDARGPMGFTQRQAAGKFTRDEAATFIDLLQESGSAGDLGLTAGAAPQLSTAERALRRVPADQLAAELQRRGWAVIEP
jgi:hypothetical protein